MADKTSAFGAFAQDSPGTSSKFFGSVTRQETQVKVGTPVSGKRLVSGGGGGKLKNHLPLFFVSSAIVEDDGLCMGLIGREGQRFCFRSHCNTKEHVLKKFGLPAEGGCLFYEGGSGRGGSYFAFRFEELGSHSVLAGVQQKTPAA